MALPKFPNLAAPDKAIRDNIQILFDKARDKLLNDPDECIAATNHGHFSQQREISMEIAPPGNYKIRLMTIIVAEVRPEIIAAVEMKAKTMDGSPVQFDVINGEMKTVEPIAPEKPCTPEA